MRPSRHPRLRAPSDSRARFAAYASPHGTRTPTPNPEASPAIGQARLPARAAHRERTRPCPWVVGHGGMAGGFATAAAASRRRAGANRSIGLEYSLFSLTSNVRDP